MTETPETPHRIVNPDSLPPPLGFAHAVVPARGTTVYLGGQAGHRLDETIAEDLVEQFDQACDNVVAALRAAGAEPVHLVSVQIFVTDVGEYVRLSQQLGEVYRRHFGKHYPAMALVGVPRLFDARALIELACVAVIPD